MLLLKIKFCILLLCLSAVSLLGAKSAKLTREELKGWARKLYYHGRTLIEYCIVDFRKLAETDEGVQVALAYLNKPKLKNWEELLHQTSEYKELQAEIETPHNLLTLYNKEIESLGKEFGKDHPGVRPSLKKFKPSQITKRMITRYEDDVKKFYRAASKSGLVLKPESQKLLILIENVSTLNLFRKIQKYMSKVENINEVGEIVRSAYLFSKFIDDNGFI